MVLLREDLHNSTTTNSTTNLYCLCFTLKSILEHACLVVALGAIGSRVLIGALGLAPSDIRHKVGLVGEPDDIVRACVAGDGRGNLGSEFRLGRA